MSTTIDISGFDVDIRRVEPKNGIFYVGGLVKSPYDRLRILWEVDGHPGTTDCMAWRGQSEIEALFRAGYRVLAVDILS